MTWSLDCNDRLFFFSLSLFWIVLGICYECFPTNINIVGVWSCVGAETWAFGSGLSVFPLRPEEVPQKVGVPRRRNISGCLRYLPQMARRLLRGVHGLWRMFISSITTFLLPVVLACVRDRHLPAPREAFSRCHSYLPCVKEDQYVNAEVPMQPPPLLSHRGPRRLRTVRGPRVRSHEEQQGQGSAKNSAEPHQHHQHHFLTLTTTHSTTRQWHSRSRARGCWSSPRSILSHFPFSRKQKK
jgi:hypothetical protein